MSAQNFEPTVFVTDSLPVNLQNKYQLNSLTIIPYSEIIVIRGKTLTSTDYSFNYKNSSFALSDSLQYSLFDTVIVRYKTIKLSLKREYKRRELTLRYDFKSGDTLQVASRQGGYLTSESIFGSSIEKSGSIVRGFTIGTNKDLSLQSGFRLQISGNLSDDIEVVAALTDENSPIQPEGNTERLDELEKVFIQIKHKNASGIFGDYELVKRSGEFGVINRKLQGLHADVNYEKNDAFISFASSKGKFHTNSFLGLDGVQGPYFLTGATGEKDIIIIAGTERIFLDGEELKRGEANDYVIEYSNAQITFTPYRLITSASRISIDFQYTDRRFTRNFFGTGANTSFFNDKLKLSFAYVREGDDQDAPIDILLSDNDKEILKGAGNNSSLAVKSGVSLAAPDSLGRIIGVYEKIDTTINQLPVEYYNYNPGTINALYNVSFTYTGENTGDYIKESVGYFRYVGAKRGNYLPIIYLPLPELKQFSTLSIETQPIKDLFINIDIAGSSWDKNRFSELNDDENLGHARNIKLKLLPQAITIGGNKFGKLGLNYRERFIQNRFTSLDRFNQVEFDRDYNTSSSSTSQNETLREAALVYHPIEKMSLTSSAGFLRRGELFRSDRYNNTFNYSDEKKYRLNYNFDYVSTKNISTESKWYRQKASAFYSIDFFRPGFEFIYEDKKDVFNRVDSVLSGSLKYYEANPYVEIVKLAGINLIYKYTLRNDFLPVQGIMEKESQSLGNQIDLNFKPSGNTSSTFNIIMRDKKFSQVFKDAGFQNSQTLLVRSQSRYVSNNRFAAGDLFYEVSTQKTAKLEKVFIQVQKGNGNYIYLGDVNNNGIMEENEFLPTLYDGDYTFITIPSDQLYPVVDLKTSTRWKFQLDQIIDGDGFIASLIKPISSETFIRVEENTQEPDLKKIYLLDFSSFQNEKLTLRGSNYIQQDLFLFENSSSLSFRFRYTQRKGLTQFSSGTERSFNKERNSRVRFKMVEEISNQSEIGTVTDNVSTAISSNRNRKIETNFINSDFSYRPQKSIEVGFKFRFAQSTDTYPENATIINSNSQGLRFQYSFSGSGRLRVEFDRAELLSNSTENFLPYELTGGNTIGKNYFWRVNFDYRFGLNLQSTASYDARLQGTGKIIHTARAEVRAFF